ncbi:MAG: TVP38/TMEM64 family protein [Anaerolineales bacterium]|nr:TVP38/TMEM64 family protein [Anaerolineales bacterium]MCB8968861.1 TVP38/TMEM64 family protein [Ardenticatenaceae bacterium]
MSSQPIQQKTIPDQPSFLRQHGAKFIALAFWLALLGGYVWYTKSNNLTITDSLSQLAAALTGSAVGPVIYIILYMIRPLIFFPATLMTVLAGFLFGPIGIIYTIIGSNSSALLAFFVGRYFGQGLLEGADESAGIINRYTKRLRDNSFETVLLMRLLFLPYDLVHYVAGFLRIDWKAFILATAIGSIPGTISIVLLGTSFGTLEELVNGRITVNPWALALSVLLIVGSIALSRYLKRRETDQLQGKQS